MTNAIPELPARGDDDSLEKRQQYDEPKSVDPAELAQYTIPLVEFFDNNCRSVLNAIDAAQGEQLAEWKSVVKELWSIAEELEIQVQSREERLGVRDPAAALRSASTLVNHARYDLIAFFRQCKSA